MPFWWQQIREEISLAQVIPDWDSRAPPAPPLDPASDATSQDTKQRHAQMPGAGILHIECILHIAY